MKVIIAGGGIGGLTTALMLHARNMDVLWIWKRSPCKAKLRKSKI